MKIRHVFAREIFNSKGNPTVEATVVLSDNTKASGSAPSGTTVSSYEAAELKDHDGERYEGLGVLKAVANINNLIAPKLVGVDALKQQEVDRIMIELDGTPNKSRLGVNAILPVSIAVAKAASKSSVLPLFLYLRQFVKKENMPVKIPTPCFNILNGGKHAGQNLDFQEFLVIPATSKSFSESMLIANAVYNSLRRTLETNNASTLVGDEGGFGPRLATNYDAIAIVKEAIDATKYRFNYDVFLGVDCAATSFHNGNEYRIKDKAAALSNSDLVSYYQNMDKDFHFLYLEDPFAEDDWEGWADLTSTLRQTMIVGDDLTATNPYRLQLALDKKAITAIIIKPNQIGTVIEALAVVEMARQSNIKIIVSHRSGETNDDFIADFAVATSADYVKFGAPVRGERVAKYNRLSEIEAQLKTLKT